MNRASVSANALHPQQLRQNSNLPQRVRLRIFRTAPLAYLAEQGA